MAIILSLLFAALVIYILLAMVLPQVYESVVGLVQSIPGYFMTLQERLMEFLANNPDIQTAVMPYYNSVAVSVEEWLQSDLLPIWSPSTALCPGSAGDRSPAHLHVLQCVRCVHRPADAGQGPADRRYRLRLSAGQKGYLLCPGQKIVYSVCETRWADLIVEEVRNAYRIMSGFINGKLLDSLIIGIIALVCCNLFNFPYPALLAVIIGVTNVIPFFGPFIGAIPCALLILIISPIQCVYFVIFILVLQQFDGNILGPKILGDSTGLASFWVLFSILLFGGLFGFAGMVLGVPVFAMFYSVVNRLVRYGLGSGSSRWRPRVSGTDRASPGRRVTPCGIKQRFAASGAALVIVFLLILLALGALILVETISTPLPWTLTPRAASAPPPGSWTASTPAGC